MHSTLACLLDMLLKQCPLTKRIDDLRSNDNPDEITKLKRIGCLAPTRLSSYSGRITIKYLIYHATHVFQLPPLLCVNLSATHYSAATFKVEREVKKRVNATVPLFTHFITTCV